MVILERKLVKIFCFFLENEPVFTLVYLDRKNYFYNTRKTILLWKCKFSKVQELSLSSYLKKTYPKFSPGLEITGLK